MKVHIRRVYAMSSCAVLIAVLGCSGPDGPPRQETYPVTGEVVVDGKAVPSILVELYDASKLDGVAGALSSAYTDDQGKFEIATYQQGDGAPEGEYVATFMWGQMDVLKGQYSGPDKLNEKYHDPQKSTFKIKVEKGKPANLGRIELKTG